MSNQEAKNTAEHKTMLKVKLPDGETEGVMGVWWTGSTVRSGKGSSVQPRQKVGSNASGISQIFQLLKDGKQSNDLKAPDKHREIHLQANLTDFGYYKKTECCKVRESWQG